MCKYLCMCSILYFTKQMGTVSYNQITYSNKGMSTLSIINNYTNNDILPHPDMTSPNTYTYKFTLSHSKGFEKVWHIPQHSSVFFMPSLYPVLPLLLGQLVLLQDSTHTNTLTSPEGMSNGTELFPLKEIIKNSNRERDTFQFSSDLECVRKLKGHLPHSR